MIFPTKFQPLRIVSSYPGSGTTETIYVAEDGSRWKEDDRCYTQDTAPPRLGRLVNGAIVPR